MIEAQGQINFETEPRPPMYTGLSHLHNDPQAYNYYQHINPIFNTKSKGMLDALYFSSRPLNESNEMSSNRLLDESKALKFGVEPNVVHQLSDPELQWLYEKLSDEHTSLFREPTENHLSLVSLLNKGFPISQMYSFKDIDFQIRKKAILNASPLFRLNPNILHTKNTQDIFNFMQFLESQPEGMRHYYVSLANGGWDWSQLYGFDTNDLAVRYETLSMGLPSQLLKEKSTYQINEIAEFLERQPRRFRSFYITFANYEWDWDQLLTLTPEEINMLIRANQSGLHSEFFKENTLQDISNLMQLLDNQPLEEPGYLESHPSQAVRSHYINMANEKYEQEAETEAETKINIVQNGAWHFSSSTAESSRHYGILYYSTLEKLLISMVCGETVEEIDLIHRGSLGFGDLQFSAPRIWKNKPTFCDQIETVHHAFTVEENGQSIYYYNLLDYVSKNIGHQITLEEFENFWSSQVLPSAELAKSEYMSRKTDVLVEDISSVYNNTGFLNYLDSKFSKSTATGLYQFNRDTTDYYLNLLITLSPKQEAFSETLHDYIDCIRQLSQYPSFKFEEIISASAVCSGEDSTWADYIEDVYSPQIPNAVAIFNTRRDIIPAVHSGILTHTLKNTYAHVQRHLPNDENSIVLLKIVKTILGAIQQSVQQSSETETEIVTLRVMHFLDEL